MTDLDQAVAHLRAVVDHAEDLAGAPTEIYRRHHDEPPLYTRELTAVLDALDPLTGAGTPPIEVLTSLRTGILNALHSAGICTIGQLAQYTDQQLLRLRQIGWGSVWEIRDAQCRYAAQNREETSS